MDTRTSNGLKIGRRAALARAGAAAGMAAGGAMVSIETHAQGRATVNLQLGWLLSGNQLGEVAAKHMGFYEAEGLDLRFQPGGPSIDGIAVVASGRFELGQVSSSPSLMLAVSQDIPIKCFAVGAQQHPFTYFSLAKAPIREPKDLIGKKVATQATAVILLKALLAKNKIAEKDVEVLTMGADMSPVLTGQAHAATGWLTNTTALKVLGKDRVDMRLWDGGVRLYALPFYATNDTIAKRGDVLAKFVRATGKGWEWASANKEKAVDFLIKEFPNLNKNDELEAADVMLKYAFNANTRQNGWGAMDPAIWKEQIDLYGELGQFSKRVPKVEEVMTLDILNATGNARPKIG
jgi:NitT/TauT family transport system substrate-binding protein